MDTHAKKKTDFRRTIKRRKIGQSAAGNRGKGRIKGVPNKTTKGNGNRTVTTKSDEKATVRQRNCFSVTPFASLDNTSF